MSAFAPELILEILEWLYYTPADQVDYTSLSSCCLVNHEWRRVAQQLLFRKVSKIKNEPAQQLATNIRVLDIEIPSGVDTTAHSQIFARVVTSCTRLYNLGITAPSILFLDDLTLSILSSSPPPIKALRISNAGVQSIILYQLLSIFPSIVHLALNFELHRYPPRESITHSFYELSVRRAPSARVLKWLLSASSSSLRILEMWDMCDRETMHALLDKHSASLLSFRTLHFDYRTAQFVRGCSNLKEIILYTIPTGIVPLDWFPKTIECFEFRNPQHASAKRLDRVITIVESLPRLRSITCGVGTVDHADFLRLRELCEKRGIKIETNNQRFPMVSRLYLYFYILTLHFLTVR